jgi:hypothetical protein
MKMLSLNRYSAIDIGSPVRITNDASSKAVAIPATAKAFVCFAESGPVRLEINGAATSTSTIYVQQDTSIMYPIRGGIQTLFCYGAVGSFGNFRFLG